MNLTNLKQIGGMLYNIRRAVYLHQYNHFRNYISKLKNYLPRLVKTDSDQAVSDFIDNILIRIKLDQNGMNTKNTSFVPDLRYSIQTYHIFVVFEIRLGKIIKRYSTMKANQFKSKHYQSEAMQITSQIQHLIISPLFHRHLLAGLKEYLSIIRGILTDASNIKQNSFYINVKAPQFNRYMAELQEMLEFR